MVDDSCCYKVSNVAFKENATNFNEAQHHSCSTWIIPAVVCFGGFVWDLLEISARASNCQCWCSNVAKMIPSVVYDPLYHLFRQPSVLYA